MAGLDLTTKEIEFLKSQGLSPSDVFDARGMTKAESKRRAKEEDKSILLGSPCKKASHRLRTRARHCIQCDTSKLGFQGRHRKSGFVYVAGSQTTGLVKVGQSIDMGVRTNKLNFDAYAGANDWQLLFWIETAESGRLESEAHGILTKYALTRDYQKDGHIQSAKECFRCSAGQAIQAIKTAIKNGKHGTIGSKNLPALSEFTS